jgi:hypothetical protein
MNQAGACTRLERLLAHLEVARVQAQGAFDWNAHQQGLPRLPLPRLEETCARYLDYVHPMLSAEEYEQTKQVVADFSNSGRELQAKLLARDAESPSTSYVKPFWDHMYLGGRYVNHGSPYIRS